MFPNIRFFMFIPYSHSLGNSRAIPFVSFHSFHFTLHYNLNNLVEFFLFFLLSLPFPPFSFNSPSGSFPHLVFYYVTFLVQYSMLWSYPLCCLIEFLISPVFFYIKLLSDLIFRISRYNLTFLSFWYVCSWSFDHPNF